MNAVVLRQRRLGSILILLLIGPWLGRPALGSSSHPEIVTDLLRFFPEAKAETIKDVLALPGLYATQGTEFGYNELYLFPDLTYASLDHTDVGISYDEGGWSFDGGTVTLMSSGAISATRKGRATPLSAVLRTDHGKQAVLLIREDLWASTVQSFAQTEENAASRWRLLAVVTVFARSKTLKPSEVAPLKAEFSEGYGKYSFDALSSKFHPSYAEAKRLPDGTFYLVGKGSSDGGLASVTVGGAILRAQRIEINREMNTITLSGLVKAASDPLPQVPGLSIIIEGEQVRPNPVR
jgi:hypothetical protein